MMQAHDVLTLTEPPLDLDLIDLDEDFDDEDIELELEETSDSNDGKKTAALPALVVATPLEKNPIRKIRFGFICKRSAGFGY